MTALECAILLGVTRRTIYRWIDCGRLAWPLDRAAIVSAPPRPRRRGAQRSSQGPRCASCGETDPSLFSPHRNRPGGYCVYCRRCNAARMRRKRAS